MKCSVFAGCVLMVVLMGKEGVSAFVKRHSRQTVPYVVRQSSVYAGPTEWNSATRPSSVYSQGSVYPTQSYPQGVSYPLTFPEAFGAPPVSRSISQAESGVGLSGGSVGSGESVRGSSMHERDSSMYVSENQTSQRLSQQGVYQNINARGPAAAAYPQARPTAMGQSNLHRSEPMPVSVPVVPATAVASTIVPIEVRREPLRVREEQASPRYSLEPASQKNQPEAGSAAGPMSAHADVGVVPKHAESELGRAHPETSLPSQTQPSKKSWGSVLSAPFRAVGRGLRWMWPFGKKESNTSESTGESANLGDDGDSKSVQDEPLYVNVAKSTSSEHGDVPPPVPSRAARGRALRGFAQDERSRPQAGHTQGRIPSIDSSTNIASHYPKGPTGNFGSDTGNFGGPTGIYGNRSQVRPEYNYRLKESDFDDLKFTDEELGEVNQGFERDVDLESDDDTDWELDDDWKYRNPRDSRTPPVEDPRRESEADLATERPKKHGVWHKVAAPFKRVGRFLRGGHRHLEDSDDREDREEGLREQGGRNKRSKQGRRTRRGHARESGNALQSRNIEQTSTTGHSKNSSQSQKSSQRQKSSQSPKSSGRGASGFPTQQSVQDETLSARQDPRASRMGLSEAQRHKREMSLRRRSIDRTELERANGPRGGRNGNPNSRQATGQAPSYLRGSRSASVESLPETLSGTPQASSSEQGSPVGSVWSLNNSEYGESMSLSSDEEEQSLDSGEDEPVYSPVVRPISDTVKPSLRVVKPVQIAPSPKVMESRIIRSHVLRGSAPASRTSQTVPDASLLFPPPVEGGLTESELTTSASAEDTPQNLSAAVQDLVSVPAPAPVEPRDLEPEELVIGTLSNTPVPIIPDLSSPSIVPALSLASASSLADEALLSTSASEDHAPSEPRASVEPITSTSPVPPTVQAKGLRHVALPVEGHKGKTFLGESNRDRMHAELVAAVNRRKHDLERMTSAQPQETQVSQTTLQSQALPDIRVSTVTDEPTLPPAAQSSESITSSADAGAPIQSSVNKATLRPPVAPKPSKHLRAGSPPPPVRPKPKGVTDPRAMVSEASTP